MFSKMKLLFALVAVLLPLSAYSQSGEIVYTDASAFPLFGKAVENTSSRYQRFTSEMQSTTRKALWDLSLNSAGLYIRFRSDAPSIHAKWHNTGFNMPHMTDIGVGGLDLYALLDGKWMFVGSGFTWTSSTSKERQIVGNMQPVMREYMLYLPLYDTIDSLEIGVPEGYALEGPAVKRPSTEGPVVMYGTSILQGGCASRPGMAHTAIISRRLDREVINLGFSGNAQLDLEVAHLIAKVKNPSLIVLDYVPNSTVQQMKDRALKFFRIIRQAHPDVPVIFVEDPTFPHSIVDLKMREEVTSKNAQQKEVFRQVKASGAKKVYYVASEGMLGDDGEACVDGIHLTDLGMMRYVDHIMPTIKKALKK